jgi:histidinol-phosphate phosphatase family protein
LRYDSGVNGRLQRLAAFLDRDGTLNRRIGYVTRPDEMELLFDAASAVARLNRAGVLAIVVTNQSAVARGLTTLETLGGIHERMLGLFADAGARIDAIYFCPHHPDFGDRVQCGCRKPLPGLLETAATEHAIDLSRSVLFGDEPSDLSAAQAAGVPGVLIGHGVGLEEAVTAWLADRRLG